MAPTAGGSRKVSIGVVLQVAGLVFVAGSTLATIRWQADASEKRDTKQDVDIVVVEEDVEDLRTDVEEDIEELREAGHERDLAIQAIKTGQETVNKSLIRQEQQFEQLLLRTVN